MGVCYSYACTGAEGSLQEESVERERVEESVEKERERERERFIDNQEVTEGR
jgi:hypothetical protein